MLRRDDRAVKLGGRALNLLSVLAEAGGLLVPRDVLLARVWPGQAIDESAIRVHLSAVRKALIEGGTDEAPIINEAGRGYRLALVVTRDEGPLIQTAEIDIVEAFPLPLRLDSVLGRDDIVLSLAEEVRRRRFITIAGPGGIGKTTAALAVAQMMRSADGIPAWFVDLASISDATLVAGAVAKTLGLVAAGGDLLGRITDRLAAGPVLLLLDNCEHLVETIALLAEELLHRVPGLLLLATSREPLRAEGEWVHRLATLGVPPPGVSITLANALNYPAIALFAERARAAHNAYHLDEEMLPAVADICRRLDGIPLAIELAAARSDAMTSAEICLGLDDRFALLSRGRRTALPRHRTLRAALDWSYALLDPIAQYVLDRLALFRSSFDVEGVVAISVAGNISAFAVRDALAELVSKSLVSASGRDRTRYRLLDTTRQYGLERLEITGSDNAARHAHASYLLTLLAGSTAAWEGKAPRQWIAAHSGYIDDVRFALAWASGAGGDPSLAAELVISSAALWFHLSLAQEFLGHAEAAVASISGDAVEISRRIELLTAYGHALWHTRGPIPAMGEAFAAALTLAEQIESEEFILRALWGVWAHRILAGDYTESLTCAARFADRVGPYGALANRQTGAHMFALSHHFAGDAELALKFLNEVMVGDEVPERAHHANHAQVDGKIAVMSLLMRLLWLRGDVEDALTLARACASDAAGIDHALSTCYGLAIGCIPVAIAAGEQRLAEEWIAALKAQTEPHDLAHWDAFVAGYSRALGMMHPEPAQITQMQREMFEVATGGWAPWHGKGVKKA